MISPIILMVILSWYGVPLGNEAEGGWIMLPLYCIFTIPLGMIFIVISWIIAFFCEWRNGNKS